MVTTAVSDTDDVESQSSDWGLFNEPFCRHEDALLVKSCDNQMMNNESQVSSGGMNCPVMIPVTSLSSTYPLVCANVAEQEVAIPLNKFDQQQTAPTAPCGTMVPCPAFVVKKVPDFAEPDMSLTQNQIQSALPIYGQSTHMERIASIASARATCNGGVRQIWQQDIISREGSQKQRQHRHVYQDPCSYIHYSPRELVNQAKDSDGSVSIQNFLKHAEMNVRHEIAHLLSGHFVELAMDKNGNHVVQRCIECLSAQLSLFIFHEILAGGHTQVSKVAKNEFGCRVLNRFLEKGMSKKHMAKLIEILLSSASALSENNFGQHVICHLLEHGSTDEQKSKLIQHLAESLSRPDRRNGRYGSKAVLHALSYAGHSAERVKLAIVVLQPERCLAMACETHRQDGAKAVKKAFEICREDASLELKVNRAVDCCVEHVDELQKSRGGKDVNKFLIESGLVRCASAMEQVVSSLRSPYGHSPQLQ
jgi:hypothetical protein